MKHYVGLSEYDLSKKRLDTQIYYEPQNLINAHMLFSGMSGSGKSTQAVGFLTSAIMAGSEIDIFDVHDEFGSIPGAAVCMFSQATEYGYNPLKLNTDPHTGGVNCQVDFVLRLIKSVTPQFGIKQEGALRSLLTDTYAAHDIFQEDPGSWKKYSISEAKRLELIAKEDHENLHRCYPTLEDLKTFAKNKLIALTIGADNNCINAFESLTRLRRRLDSLLKQRTRATTDGEMKKLDDQIRAQGEKCIDTYTRFIDSMESGREIDNVLKYDSVDVLTSVLQRLILLGSTGIMSANQPPFGESKVRVHQIKSISNEQQILYVKLRLQDIFDRCKRAGTVAPGSTPRWIIFLDEAHKFFSDDPSDIINVIAKEARKFGLGLWAASQQPTAFPESFLTNVGATILLGIHTSYWKRASSMFRISEESLKSVKPKEVMAIKFLQDGCVDPPFSNIIVPNPGTPMGRRALTAKP